MPPSDAPRRLSVVVAGGTDVGRVRERNEDAYLIAGLAEPITAGKGTTDVITIAAPPASLIVADGVGGSASGELASVLALETVLVQLRRKYDSGALTSIPDSARALLKALAVTNQTVYRYAIDHPEHQGMATTITLALTCNDAVLVAQIGDSRAYIVRQGIAQQITKDQSLVQQLIDMGELTESEAAYSHHRNIILQALGSEPIVSPDLYCVNVQAGDILILCTDGLSNYLTLSDIANLTNKAPDMTAICANLIAYANARGGDDNITVVAARFDRIGNTDPADSPGTPSPIKLVSTSPGFADLVRRWLR